MNKHINPPTVHAPQGPYSHAVEVSPDARLVTFAGHDARQADGAAVSDTVEGQMEQALRNLLDSLQREGMQATDIVRMTTYVVTPQRGLDLIIPIGRARNKVLGGEARPPGALVVVKALAEPELLVQVDAIAAKV